MGSGSLALLFALLSLLYSALISDAFNDAVSTSVYIASNGKKINERPIGNDMEVFKASFKALTRISLGENEENHDNAHSG
jgi:hypothetical protein